MNARTSSSVTNRVTLSKTKKTSKSHIQFPQKISINHLQKPQKTNKYKKQLQKANKQLKNKISTVKSNYKNSYIYQYKGNSTTNYQVIPTAENYQKLHDRKQSHLNTKYSARKNNLMSITKTNKKIHQRINSQQSRYSARQHNASYEVHRSRCQSISRSRSRYANNGLDSSRYSNKSNKSKSSSRVSKQTRALKTKTKSASNIKLQPLKINQLNKTQQFVRMFAKPNTNKNNYIESDKKQTQINDNKKTKNYTASIYENCIQEDENQSPKKKNPQRHKKQNKSSSKMYPPLPNPYNKDRLSASNIPIKKLLIAEVPAIKDCNSHHTSINRGSIRKVGTIITNYYK